jgi:hypothetical protein
MRADAVRHHHDKAAIIHVLPIAAVNEFVLGVASERAIGLCAKVWFVKGHGTTAKVEHLFYARQ